jgi:hypothetical protein
MASTSSKNMMHVFFERAIWEAITYFKSRRRKKEVRGGRRDEQGCTSMASALYQQGQGGSERLLHGPLEFLHTSRKGDSDVRRVIFLCRKSRRFVCIHLIYTVHPEQRS